MLSSIYGVMYLSPQLSPLTMLSFIEIKNRNYLFVLTVILGGLPVLYYLSAIILWVRLLLPGQNHSSLTSLSSSITMIIVLRLRLRIICTRSQTLASQKTQQF